MQKAVAAAPAATLQVPSADVPQANQLGKVRQLVELAQGGRASPAQLRRSLGLDSRHVAYYRRAAEVLSLVESPEGSALRTTAAGEALLRTEENSDAERQTLLEAIRGAASLRPFLSYLEGTEALSTDALRRRISEVSGLGDATALRRASSLEQWRAYLVGAPAKRSAPSPLDELPPRIQEIVNRAVMLLRHGLEHYNAFSCPVRSLVAIQHIDHALELLVKGKLATSGRPEALESDEYDLFRCINVLAGLPALRTEIKRPALLVLLHRQRNLVQHAGESVPDDLLTLLVAYATKLFIDWADLLFGMSLDQLFPRRHGIALPNFDIDIRAVQERHVERLRAAARSKERLAAGDVRAAVYMNVALDPELSDDEKESLFSGRPPMTPRGRELAHRLQKAAETHRSSAYSELAEYLATSPALHVMSKTAGARSGAVPVYVDPKHPNAVPVKGSVPEYVIGDARSELQAEMASWRTARLEQRFDFISPYSLVRLYRRRTDSALVEIRPEEIEALALSSMKHGLAFWAWLGRMDPSKALQWAKEQLAAARDYDLLRPLAHVVCFGTGAHFRAALEKHTKDGRRSVRAAFSDFIALYDAPEKLARIRAANVTMHPADLVDVVRDADDPKLNTEIDVESGAGPLRAFLMQGEPGLELLRRVFPTLTAAESRLVAKWVLMARCATSLEFALDHVFHSDPSVRSQSRQFVRKYDTVAHCPFLAA